MPILVKANKPNKVMTAPIDQTGCRIMQSLIQINHLVGAGKRRSKSRNISLNVGTTVVPNKIATRIAPMRMMEG
jgi:hypothetical protein